MRVGRLIGCLVIVSMILQVAILYRQWGATQRQASAPAKPPVLKEGTTVDLRGLPARGVFSII